MDETFLDLISKCQSHRLDDQRSEFPSPTSSDRNSTSSSQDEDDLFDTLWRMQSSRIEEQRCQMPPQAQASGSSRQEAEAEALSSDELFELIFASQVRKRVCVGGMLM